MLMLTGSEFLGSVINVRYAAKKPPSQLQKPRGKGRHDAVMYCILHRSLCPVCDAGPEIAHKNTFQPDISRTI